MRIPAARSIAAGLRVLSGCLLLVAPALHAQHRQAGDYDSVGAHPDHPLVDMTPPNPGFIVHDNCATVEKCAWECGQKKNYLSCYRTGVLYSSGGRIEKNLAEAANYYQRACELGDGQLRHGATLKHDDRRAEQVEQLACDRGIATACLAPHAAVAAVSAPAAASGSPPEPAAISAPVPLPRPPPNCTGDAVKPADGDSGRRVGFDRSYLPDAERIVEAAALPAPPTLLSRASPEYPDPVMDRTIQGKFYVQGMSGVTMLEVIIDEQGNVTHPLLLCTDNLRKTVYELAALKKWRYQPVTLDGKPVKVRSVITYKLEIGSKK
jgi:hypothetical protein